MVRVMLHKFQKQSEMLEAFAESIKNQRAMLRRVMNVLHLNTMEGFSDEHPGDFDMTMRPPSTQWDPPGPQNEDT